MADYGFDRHNRMRPFAITCYQPGFEREHARIGREVASEWIWPYAYDLVDLQRLHARPDFDPETCHYCFLGDEMVGYVVSTINTAEAGAPTTATLDFPRVVPPHAHVAEELMERALSTLRDKGVSRVEGRVTTMCPEHIKLAEKSGFTISDWGYKVYYAYEMAWGKRDIVGDVAQEIDSETDLGACAELAARWYKRPTEWCRAHLAEWHAAGAIITHAGVRREGTLVAACMAAPNEIRPLTAAIYYIHTPDELALRSMLSRVIDLCVDYRRFSLIADLIHEHRQFEPVYQALGFEKAAEWARCELVLDSGSAHDIR